MRSKIDQYLREQNQPKSDDTVDTTTIKAADLGIPGGGTVTGTLTSSDPYAAVAGSFNSPGGPLPAPVAMLLLRCTDGGYVTGYASLGQALQEADLRTQVNDPVILVGDGGHQTPYIVEDCSRTHCFCVRNGGHLLGWVTYWYDLRRSTYVYTFEPNP